DVARFDARPAGGNRVAAAAIIVVGAHQRVERRLSLGALVIGWIDVEHTAAGVGLRLGARAYGYNLRDGLRGLAGEAVRIGHHESSFIRRAGLEVENASGKHVGRDDVEYAFGLEDALALQAQEGQRLLPLR